MNQQLSAKLKTLPNSPGVYFHKSSSDEIIYVGKAAVLKNRVRQYFQKSRDTDAKTRALVAEIAMTDWIETETELDALFLESEMIKRYMPRYNIDLRDDKAPSYVRISAVSETPRTVTFTRQPLDDRAEYIGPFYSSTAVKNALRILRKSFPYYAKKSEVGSKLLMQIGLIPNMIGKAVIASETKQSNSCHPELVSGSSISRHSGLDPESSKKNEKLDSPNKSGNDGDGYFQDNNYDKDLKKLSRILHGGRAEIVKEIESEMKTAARDQNFELAAKLRNQLMNLRELKQQMIFGREEFLDISKDEALSGLKKMLNLENIPRRIEAYDISHISGTNNVGSMVVATNGVADKREYRKFKLRTGGNDDYVHMRETIERRMKHLKDWGRPDLVIIDGGIGQLNAVADLLNAENIPFIGRNKSGDHGRNARVTIAIPTSVISSNVEQSTRKFPAGHPELVSGSNNNEVVKDDAKLNWIPGQARNDGRASYQTIELSTDDHIAKLIARLDEEAHRFAVSYHQTLRAKNQTKNVLEEIPGIGPATRKKLIRKFGSVVGIRTAPETEIAKIVGQSKAKFIKQHIGTA